MSSIAPKSLSTPQRMFILSFNIYSKQSLVLTDIKQMGACNQGKENKILLNQFTRRHSLCYVCACDCEPSRNARLTSLVFNRQKKSPVMALFLPVCVKHSKGFSPRIVEARLKCGHSAESLRNKSFFISPIRNTYRFCF